MKVKSLQFGKAMSAALFVLLLSVAGMKNAPAQNQVAVLQHEGNISTFYGINALSSASIAAADGDTITLSSGTFNGCTISKALTIHGAGCIEDAEIGIMPTKLSYSYGLTINASNDTIPFTMEGVHIDGYCYCNGSNICFKKCNIYNFFTGYYSSTLYEVVNLQLYNCIVKTFQYYGHGLTVVNSVLGMRSYSSNNIEDNYLVYNSVIVLETIANSNLQIYNSVISRNYASFYIENTSFYNCIGITLNSNASLFGEQVNNTNMDVTSYSDVFETFAGEITYDNRYQLKEEIANSFLGNDGTEVGIYGGMMPYNPRPSYMIIKRCNVAGRTTEDNKLSVEIELNTGD